MQSGRCNKQVSTRAERRQEPTPHRRADLTALTHTASVQRPIETELQYLSNTVERIRDLEGLDRLSEAEFQREFCSENSLSHEILVNLMLCVVISFNLALCSEAWHEIPSMTAS
jgi:hypothetical protein